MFCSANIAFSSKTDLWATPQALFDQLDAIHHFTLDVCATDDNAKCKQYITPEMDAFLYAWVGVCWMNPPYGRTIAKWIEKAYLTSLQGHKVVCLLPARTDTPWFHNFCTKGDITFLRGRLKFGDAKNPAPFPSMIVVF